MILIILNSYNILFVIIHLCIKMVFVDNSLRIYSNFANQVKNM